MFAPIPLFVYLLHSLQFALVPRPTVCFYTAYFVYSLVCLLMLCLLCFYVFTMSASISSSSASPPYPPFLFSYSFRLFCLLLRLPLSAFQFFLLSKSVYFRDLFVSSPTLSVYILCPLLCPPCLLFTLSVYFAPSLSTVRPSCLLPPSPCLLLCLLCLPLFPSCVLPYHSYLLPRSSCLFSALSLCFCSYPCSFLSFLSTSTPSLSHTVLCICQRISPVYLCILYLLPAFLVYL